MGWNGVITVDVRYIRVQDARAIILAPDASHRRVPVRRRPPQSPSPQTSLGVSAVQTAVTLHQDSPRSPSRLSLRSGAFKGYLQHLRYPFPFSSHPTAMGRWTQYDEVRASKVLQRDYV